MNDFKKAALEKERNLWIKRREQGRAHTICSLDTEFAKRHTARCSREIERIDKLLAGIK